MLRGAQYSTAILIDIYPMVLRVLIEMCNQLVAILLEIFLE